MRRSEIISLAASAAAVLGVKKRVCYGGGMDGQWRERESERVCVSGWVKVSVPRLSLTSTVLQLPPQLSQRRFVLRHYLGGHLVMGVGKGKG